MKTVAGILTALILWITLSRHGKDHAVLLTVAVCAMVVTVAISFLQPVLAFLQKVQVMGELDEELVNVVLKAVGIGLIGEITALICKDAGNESMGKALQILSTMVILRISIPVFDKLLTLLERILGSV